MPAKATKHIPKTKEPIGTVKDGKLKVVDGETGKPTWRSGKKGFAQDYDGEPTTKDYNSKDLKHQPSHKPHHGGRRKHHTPHEG